MLSALATFDTELNAFLTALEFATCIVDGASRVVSANHAWCSLLGLDADRVRGRSLRELLPGRWADEVRAMVDGLAADPSKRLAFGECIDLSAPDSVRSVRVLAGGMRDGTGAFDHAKLLFVPSDHPAFVEASAPSSPERLAALRIADRHALGPRHTEMLVLLATGHRVPTIATTLFLANGTVRNRISALGTALGVQGQAGIVGLIQAEVGA